MEVGAEKAKILTNSANSTQRNQNWVPLQASCTAEQLFQMMAQDLRFSQGLQKPLQLLQS